MYKTIKTMRQALEEARSYRDPIKEDKGFSTQQIKMAYGILNDPRYKQGNYSGAVNAIEKIAKGLSDHPDVANALKRANESLEEGTITEFKKMTVTFKDMDSFAKAYVDLAKKGFKLQGQGLEIKVDGNGADLNKYAADMNNSYGATVKAESLEESIFDGSAMQTIKLKNGTKVLDKIYTNRFQADNAASALMKHRKGNNITKADAYQSPFNNKFYVRIKEDLEEAVFDSDAMQTIKLKNGTKVLDKIYTDRTQADNAASSLMKQHKGAKADAYYNLVNKKFYVRIKEDLEERFSRQDANKFDMAKYKENERNNQHGDNALLLVKKFGTAADYKKIVDIDIRHLKAGSISAADQKTRDDISKKYFGRLM